MAYLIQEQFDSFTSNPEVNSVDIRIPHSFADMCRDVAKQELVTNERASSLSGTIHLKVTMIKYLRRQFKTENGCPIGLRDAKDIVDHYYVTCNRVRNPV